MGIISQLDMYRRPLAVFLLEGHNHKVLCIRVTGTPSRRNQDGQNPTANLPHIPDLDRVGLPSHMYGTYTWH